jgi:hypothetical protein
MSGSLHANCNFERPRCSGAIWSLSDFENSFDKSGDYHDRLIERVSLDIPDVRPAFLPTSERPIVRELKAFQHVFRYAYDLKFRQDRLAELVTLAASVSADYAGWVESFVEKIRAALETDAL